MRYDYFIGCDPGTTSGWAILDWQGELLECGEWNRKPGKGEEPMSLGQLMADQYGRVQDLMDGLNGAPSLFVFEDVQFSSGGSRSSHVMGVMKGATELAVTPYDEVEWLPVAVGTWKKEVVGSGSASKKDYIRYACERFDMKLLQRQEDIASALCLATYGFLTRGEIV